MAAAAVDALYVPGRSVVHRLPAQCKVAGAVLLVLAVVATPARAGWAYAQHAAVLGTVVALAELPLRLIVRRATVEIPFVAFAFALPFVAAGPRARVGPLTVSQDGLWAAGSVLFKSTFGVVTMIVLTATTTIAGVLGGLDRLRVPRPVTAIAGFMVRYVDVIGADMRRMRIARLSRGHDPRWFWQAGAVARSAGALFVRSYERGERVHLAMVARGYEGVMPGISGAPATARHWLAATAPALAAAFVAAFAAVAAA